MFTIKYRCYNRIDPKPSHGDPLGQRPTYTENEQIHGPFAFVSFEVDDDGYVVVHAHRDNTAPGMTFGPCLLPEVAGEVHPRPTLWVMNEAGATVAKYDL